MRMSYEAQGIYMRILCHMWTDSRDQCSIINDDKAIAGMLGISKKKWQAIKKEIQYDGDSLLKQKGKKLFSFRLKKEAEKLQNYHRLQSERGKKSAKNQYLRQTTVKPRLNHGCTTVKPARVQPEGNSSSSSSSSSTKKDNKEINKEIRHQIITYLNEKTKKNFNPDSDATAESINGRIDDGAKWEDFKHVIDVKVGEWLGHPRYDQYLRPSTLFRPSKFEDYRNQRYIPDGDHVGATPKKLKTPQQEKRLTLIEKKRSDLTAKHKSDLDNADTLEKKEAIQALIATQVATYSRQLEGEG